MPVAPAGAVAATADPWPETFQPIAKAARAASGRTRIEVFTVFLAQHRPPAQLPKANVARGQVDSTNSCHIALVWSVNAPVSAQFMLGHFLHVCSGSWARRRVSESVPAQREMESGRSPLASIPPFGRGFSRHPGLPIRCGSGKGAKGDFRARRHRLDEPTRLSLGMVASPQSPLPFHLAEPL
jgi:hypothetical protein